MIFITIIFGLPAFHSTSPNNFKLLSKWLQISVRILYRLLFLTSKKQKFELQKKKKKNCHWNYMQIDESFFCLRREESVSWSTQFQDKRNQFAKCFPAVSCRSRTTSKTMIAIEHAVKDGVPVMKRCDNNRKMQFISSHDIVAPMGLRAGWWKLPPEFFCSQETPLCSPQWWDLPFSTGMLPTTKRLLKPMSSKKFQRWRVWTCGGGVAAWKRCRKNWFQAGPKVFDRGQEDEFERWHGLECIECGKVQFCIVLPADQLWHLRQDNEETRISRYKRK